VEFLQRHTISEIEINRRKKAFSFLISSLFVGVSLTLKLLLGLPDLPLFLSMAVFAAFLLICRLLMEKAFNSFSKIIVVLTDEYIERIKNNGSEKIFFKDILAVNTKITFQKNIREIKIVAKDKQLYLNGIVNINGLSRTLKKFVSKDTKITQVHEFINFDGKYFYPIFGLLMGVGAVFLLDYIMNSSSQFIGVLLSFFMVIVIGLGGYFVITKPISKSHGLRFRVADIVIGIIFVILGVVLLYSNLV
jgi:hypothetical protein